MIYNSILQTWSYTHRELDYYEKHGYKLDNDYISCCKMQLKLNSFKKMNMITSYNSLQSSSLDKDEQESLIISQQCDNIFFYLEKIVKKHEKYILTICYNVHDIFYINKSNVAENLSFDSKLYTLNDLNEILNQEVLEEKIEKTISALSDTAEKIFISPYIIQKDGSCTFLVSSK